MKPIYTTIPVDLCKYALTKQKVNQVLLFVFLKHIASGHIHYDTSQYKVWAVDLNISEKTIRSCMRWLIKRRWLTVNNKRQSLRIIGYEQLHTKLQFKSLSAVRYEPDDFSGFKSFCCAVVITYYLRLKSWADKKSWSGSKMDDSSKSRYSNPKGFRSLPISYLAKCLGVSKATANNYKQTAVKADF